MRYLLYAATTAAGAAVYLVMDGAPEDAALPRNTAAPALSLALPELASSGGPADSKVKRDLFKIVTPPPAPPPPPVVVTAPPPPAPPPPDRLAGLKVIGLVSRGAHLAVLVEVDNEALIVESGQRFGKEEALTIDGIEANHVLVLDKIANVSKTFILSEE